MKKVKCKVLVYILCSLLLFGSMPVYAAIDNDTLSLAQFHFIKLGFIVKDWDWFLDNADFQTYCLNLNNGTYFYQDDKGNYVFTDEASDVAKGIIDAYISEQNGDPVNEYDCGDYYLVPTFSYQDLWDYINEQSENNSGYWLVNSRNVVSEIMNSCDAMIIYHDSAQYYRALQMIPLQGLDNYVGSPYGSYFSVSVYDDMAVRKSIVGQKTSIQFNSGTSEPSKTDANVSSSLYVDVGGYPVYKYQYWTFITRNGEYIRAWKSAEKLAAFLTDTWSKPKYYKNSSYTSFDVSQDNTFSIDQQTYNNIKGNFNTVNQQFSQVIDDINIQNNSSITYNQLQQIIDNSITNIVNNYYYVIVDPEEPETETGPGNQEVLDKLDEQSKQDKEFRQEDLEGASSAGDAMGTFASDLETGIYNQWRILFFPIEFTETISSAFQGSSGSTYSLRYDGITGYTYDSESGTLQPVYSKERNMSGIPSVSRGTVLTFPEYTLPGLNIKLWDAYQYDLTILTVDYPLIFDALYVLCCVIETVWFVEFLHRKFMEVFTR